MGKRAAPPRYASDIPAGATAHERSVYRVEDRRVDLRTVEYRVGKEVVGKRLFDADGTLTYEAATRDGRMHGRVYEFHASGALSCFERYVRGVQHGTCYQWDEEGRLLGRYVLHNGSGLDVWRHRGANGRVVASEIRTLRRGLRHGFEWWLSGRQLSSETHFVDGKMHASSGRGAPTGRSNALTRGTGSTMPA